MVDYNNLFNVQAEQPQYANMFQQPQQSAPMVDLNAIPLSANTLNMQATKSGTPFDIVSRYATGIKGEQNDALKAKMAAAKEAKAAAAALEKETREEQRQIAKEGRAAEAEAKKAVAKAAAEAKVKAAELRDKEKRADAMIKLMVNRGDLDPANVAQARTALILGESVSSVKSGKATENMSASGKYIVGTPDAARAVAKVLNDLKIKYADDMTYDEVTGQPIWKGDNAELHAQFVKDYEDGVSKYVDTSPLGQETTTPPPATTAVSGFKLKGIK